MTIDKCTLKAYQEFCHDLSFSESKRNHNDTPDDGRLTKALWSVPVYAGRGSLRRLQVTGKRTTDHCKKVTEKYLLGKMPGKDVTTMNRVILMGRLTKNPEINYAGKDNDMAVARYTLAIVTGKP